MNDMAIAQIRTLLDSIKGANMCSASAITARLNGVLKEAGAGCLECPALRTLNELYRLLDEGVAGDIGAVEQAIVMGREEFYQGREV